MMSVSFKVNTDLLRYLLLTSDKYLINEDYVHPTTLIDKPTKGQKKEYTQFLSQKLLEKYIINLAKTYSTVPEIYYPLKLDNRGIMYPLPAYFHYQGCELAKALLLFSKPDIINRNDATSIEYLKSYGSVCFGNGLNLYSYEKRLEWVNKNWDRIIYFENNSIIDESENKFLFLAFCFEMRRFNNFLQNENITQFKTYLPIQLDGTCNGFQHLALLSNEVKIFETFK